MTKRPEPSSKFIYVHGTNGSGKSTLARAVIAASGGVDWVEDISHPGEKVRWTRTKSHVSLVGKYDTACGGADGLSPYASIHDVLHRILEWGAQDYIPGVLPPAIFAEGLITPGVETCARLADQCANHLFIFLDTPIDQCIRNVLARRGRKGTTKEYDTKNLLKKHQSASNWIRRLEAAGLKTASLTWDNAYSRILQEYSLPQPRVEDLL
jgi:ABC-type dipeptide/oligopeptide/nickel transport system ATPase subunit